MKILQNERKGEKFLKRRNSTKYNERKEKYLKNYLFYS